MPPEAWEALEQFAVMLARAAGIETGEEQG